MLTEIVDEIEAGHVAEPTIVAAQMGVGSFAAAVTRQFEEPDLILILVTAQIVRIHNWCRNELDGDVAAQKIIAGTVNGVPSNRA